MDTSGVERFFTLWPEDGEEKEEKPKVHINVGEEPYRLRTSCQESFEGRFSASVFSACRVSGCRGGGSGDVGSIHLHGRRLPADLPRQLVRAGRQGLCPSQHALRCARSEQEKVPQDIGSAANEMINDMLQKRLERKRARCCRGNMANG